MIDELQDGNLKMRVQMLYKIFNDIASPGPTPITRMVPTTTYVAITLIIFIHYVVRLIHSNTPFSLKQSNYGTIYPLKSLYIIFINYF